MCIETKSWQTNPFFSYSQTIQKKKKNKESKKFPKHFLKNSQDFENIQFLTSHLKAETLSYLFFLLTHKIHTLKNQHQSYQTPKNRSSESLKLLILFFAKCCFPGDIFSSSRLRLVFSTRPSITIPFSNLLKILKTNYF